MSEEVGAHRPSPHRDHRAVAMERQVEIRCSFAEQAQREADAAAARVVEARRQYDEHSVAMAAAQAELDPGATLAAKEKAHKAFRSAVAAAQSRGQVETAANAWLKEINRVNRQSRAAFARVEAAHAEANALQIRIARLSDSAESTARMAVTAMDSCRAAQSELASMAGPEEAPTAPPTTALDGAWTPEVSKLAEAAAERQAAEASSAEAATGAAEGAVAGHAVAAPGAAGPAEAVAGSGPAGAEEEAPAPRARPGTGPTAPPVLASAWLVIDLSSQHPQVIVRLIRRDPTTMGALVDKLAGADATDRARWQLNLSTFVDSVIAAAIDEACFEFGPGNPFWDQFTAAESREIAGGLAALGFRYDGMGGFVDGRVPTNRDLALAVGQAGLLPVKIRHWPSAQEAPNLLQGVRVSADTFIAARAPALTLGECVRMLGRRADYLADLWNDWPRWRPLLFSTGL
jgi:hypothetical protein